ncbi:hypothetical protein K0504_15985 [Neiella marina]|uniref:Aminoglycoside phosphotransferase domain-containing protein n=1 Tax=Neiella holothuriorum TaxID=2870530 RepID=A0ABS7EJR8_9GAMM|nr:phosphotransferase [Neiella holothuriorum]MBW8192540.1 hypothetical protein [Neiella holothuriorum]
MSRQQLTADISQPLTPAQCAAAAGLAGPIQWSAIETGLSHDSFHVRDAAGTSYFLRIYQAARKPWLNRPHELKVQAEASQQGLTPKLTYLDDQQRFFFSEYVEDDTSASLTLAQLTSLIERVGDLPVHFAMKQADRLTHYIHQAERQFSATLGPKSDEWQRVVAIGKQAVSELDNQCWPQVPSFLDWHRGNLLLTKQTAYLVDFEYLVLSELPLELASLKLSELLPSADWPALKSAAEQQYGATVPDETISIAERLYWAMCYCWYWAVSPETAAEPTLRVVRQLTED